MLQELEDFRFICEAPAEREREREHPGHRQLPFVESTAAESTDPGKHIHAMFGQIHTARGLDS